MANMDTPRSLNVAPAPLGKLPTTTARIDGWSLSAVLAISVGWFFIDTLAVTLGSLQHGVRFFDISAAIADPTRIFFGVDSSFQRIFFVLICFVCLLAPLLAQWRSHRMAWLAYLAPLGLMVLCGALLYVKTSSEFFSAPSDVNSLSSGALRFAHDLVHRGSGLVSKHVSIGAGGYLSFAGSLMLAVQGMRQLRRAT
jgi:hypothetical protein